MAVVTYEFQGLPIRIDDVGIAYCRGRSFLASDCNGLGSGFSVAGICLDGKHAESLRHMNVKLRPAAGILHAVLFDQIASQIVNSKDAHQCWHVLAGR